MLQVYQGLLWGLSRADFDLLLLLISVLLLVFIQLGRAACVSPVDRGGGQVAPLFSAYTITAVLFFSLSL